MSMAYTLSITTGKKHTDLMKSAALLTTIMGEKNYTLVMVEQNS